MRIYIKELKDIGGVTEGVFGMVENIFWKMFSNFSCLVGQFFFGKY